MPIFFRDNSRILYVHVPKTGGSFIEQTFVRNKFQIDYIDGGKKPGKLNQVRHCSPQHMDATILKAIFDLSKFDYIFMTVREPLERFISEFRMKRKNESQDINLWLREKLKQYRKNPYINDNHLRPQVEFYIQGVTIFKQEDRYDEQWIESLRKDSGINISLQDIKNVMVRDHSSKDTARDVREKLSPESLKILTNFYAEDFTKFGYPLPEI